MNKTLVIIIGGIRGYNTTFPSFKTNVIDHYKADLCLCVGAGKDYDYQNPYHLLAKYKFYVDEPKDYGPLFDAAFDKECQTHGHFEEFSNNIPSGLVHLIQSQQSNQYFRYLGESKSFDIKTFDGISAQEVLVFDDNYSDARLRNQVYMNLQSSTNLVYTRGCTTYRKHIHWRQFLQIKDQWLGGVKHPVHQHPGTAGLLIYYRWYLQQILTEHGLLNKYDRFYITRSDFVYTLPPPLMQTVDPHFIWIPDSEMYYGYTDRHAILSKNNILPYLGIFTNMVKHSHRYFKALSTWRIPYVSHKIKVNLEQTIMIHLILQAQSQLVRHYPYTMFSIREPGGQTGWSVGKYDPELKVFIKYQSEKEKAEGYLNKFQRSKLPLSEFYRRNFLMPTPVNYTMST